MKYGFGIDVGGTSVKLALFDLEGNIVEKWSIPTRTEDGGKHVLPDIAASVLECLEKKEISRQDVIGIGVGIPGPVSEDGIVNRCVNLGWGVVDLHGELGRLTGFSICSGNDANVATLGECWKGSGDGSRFMVMVTLGTGIGGGIILNGKIIGGFHGAGGEIGHMVMTEDETEPCGCGNYGCAEQYCSANGTVRLAKRWLARHDEPSVLRQMPSFSCKELFDAAYEGDHAAQCIVEEFNNLMGKFLANICCTIDPEVIVIGGGVSRTGQPLLDGIRPYFDKYAFHACRSTKIVLAALGNDAGIYGAFKLALEAYENSLRR